MYENMNIRSSVYGVARNALIDNSNSNSDSDNHSDSDAASVGQQDSLCGAS